MIALALAACLLMSPPPGDDYLTQAQEHRENSAWQKLLDLSLGQPDPKAGVPLSYTAIAKAGLRDFSGAVTCLKELQARGVDVNDAVHGVGSPLVEVVNTTYNHCWANFDAAFNRLCWSDLFATFPDSPYAPVAASRLLMASLKEGKTDEVQLMENFFEDRLAAAKESKDLNAEADLTKRFVDGYLRAGVSNERIVELAHRTWNLAWDSAASMQSFAGPVTGGDLSHDDLLARRSCELATDKAFNALAQATHLAGLPLSPESPIFAMESEPSVTFTDCTKDVGLADVRRARVAVGDFDSDGDPDLSLCGQLFVNSKGSFRDESSVRGISQRGAGSVFGDYNADGALDLLVASRAGAFLYRNLGKQWKYRFEDARTEAGLDSLTFPSTPEGIAFVDVDDDGDLDIYFALYEEPMSEGHSDIVLENQGDGTFKDASVALQLSENSAFCGRGVSPCDVDLDGDCEVFVSNYRLNPNTLWSYEGGVLTDTSNGSVIKGLRQPEDGRYFGHTIGSAFGDVDGDGDLDLLTANLAHPRFVSQGFSNLSYLCIQQADGSFVDEALERGLRFQETHSDPAFVDIDNDGDLDLSITCIYEGVTSALYQNDGNGHFTPITFRSGAQAFHAWGQAWLDFDGDGFMDVIYASGNGVRALRNSGNTHHFLRIVLESKGADSNGFGAIVRAQIPEGDTPRVLTRQLVNVRGTTSQDEAVIHLGLGDYNGRVNVSVTWPDTNRTESKNPRADTVFTIKQGRKAR